MEGNSILLCGGFHDLLNRLRSDTLGWRFQFYAKEINSRVISGCGAWGSRPFLLEACDSMKPCVVLSIAFLLLLAPGLYALDDGLARTPPMGWNSWNKFGCNVSEDLIKGAADALVSSGMRDAGYQYLVIDDCWQIDRDANGNIVADAKRFPTGMKALADYVHSSGPEVRPLLGCRQEDLRRDGPAAATSFRTPGSMPLGASTI